MFHAETQAHRSRIPIITQPHPLPLTEFIRHKSIGFRDVIKDHRKQESLVICHQVRAIHRQLPLQPEITLRTCVSVCRNDWHKKGTFLNLFANLLVPRIAATQIRLIEPRLQPGRAQGIADAACSVGVLGGVGEEDGLGHWLALRRDSGRV